jgi:hypothetical protein
MTDAPKKPRGPKKSAADKLAELIASKRKERDRLSVKYDAAAVAKDDALRAHNAADSELAQLMAAHKALTGAGDA